MKALNGNHERIAVSDTSRGFDKGQLGYGIMRNPKHIRHVYANDVAFALPDLETCRLIFRSSDDKDDEVCSQLTIGAAFLYKLVLMAPKACLISRQTSATFPRVQLIIPGLGAHHHGMSRASLTKILKIKGNLGQARSLAMALAALACINSAKPQWGAAATILQGNPASRKVDSFRDHRNAA